MSNLLDMAPKLLTVDLASDDGLLVRNTGYDSISAGLAQVVTDAGLTVRHLQLAPVMQRFQTCLTADQQLWVYVNAPGRGACLLAHFRDSTKSTNIDLLFDLSMPKLQYFVYGTQAQCLIFTQSDLFQLPPGYVYRAFIGSGGGLQTALGG